MKNLRSLSVAVLFAVGILAGAGCKERTTAEKMGDAIEDAAEKTADAAKDGAREVGKAAEKAGDKIKDATN